MTARENSAQDRRVSSFRIDDILATPSESRRTETQHAANAEPSSSQPAQLSFGVDQLLANTREPESRNQLPCYGKVLIAKLNVAAILSSVIWHIKRICYIIIFDC